MAVKTAHIGKTYRLSLTTSIYGSTFCFYPAEDTALDTALNVMGNLLHDSLGEYAIVYMSIHGKSCHEACKQGYNVSLSGEYQNSSTITA